MQIIDCKKLSDKYKRNGKISPEANYIANKLICELCIQLNGQLARLLDVDYSLDNHKAIRVWVQKYFNNSEQYNIDDYEFFKCEIFKCIPYHS